jgi:hypothetical protein
MLNENEVVIRNRHWTDIMTEGLGQKYTAEIYKKINDINNDINNDNKKISIRFFNDEFETKEFDTYYNVGGNDVHTYTQYIDTYYKNVAIEKGVSTYTQYSVGRYQNRYHNYNTITTIRLSKRYWVQATGGGNWSMCAVIDDNWLLNVPKTHAGHFIGSKGEIIKRLEKIFNHKLTINEVECENWW